MDGLAYSFPLCRFISFAGGFESGSLLSSLGFRLVSMRVQ